MQSETKVDPPAWSELDKCLLWLGLVVTRYGFVLSRVEYVLARFTRESNSGGCAPAVIGPIVEAHGGRLWAEANPGSGMTFRFTLAEA